MDKLTHSTKRKKRKTRKCLDKIRSRSRRQPSQKLLFKACTSKCKTNDRLITTDRLTLKVMFPKAIRSETITRSALTEINEKQSVHIVDFVRDKLASNSSSIKQVIGCNAIHTRSNNNNITVSDSNGNQSCLEDGYKNDYDAKSSSSFVLFSSTSPTTKPLLPGTRSNEQRAGTSTPSSRTSQTDYRRRLYEEFMNEIPSYFTHLTSTIIKEDVIKNTINNLQKLYVESCQNEYENNILRCIDRHLTTSNSFCSLNETIVDSPPLDYIRLEYGRRQNRTSLLTRGTSASPSLGISASLALNISASPALSIAASPALSIAASLALSISASPALDISASPALDISASTARSCSSSSTSALVAQGNALYDSPEFTYYPHRLN